MMLTMSAAIRRSYDHRLRELVCGSGDRRLASRAGVPRSTAASWRQRGCRNVVTVDLVHQETRELQEKVLQLEHRMAVLLAMVRLLWALVRVRGARLEEERLPEGTEKAALLTAIARAKPHLGLDTALRLMGLSASRYHAWRQPLRLCQLDDLSSCPKTTPAQLTAAEVRTLHAMATDPDYRHIPVSGLAMLAQRLGRVFASATTWSRLIREHGWRRPRERVHPQSPSEGIRATRPNEYWHIDITVIRLLNGTHVNLQAVIDNFSRRILAWRVESTKEPRLTRQLLLEAAKWLPRPMPVPTLVADSGTENVNGEVDGLVSSGVIKRVLAQVEVVYSNSMIEAYWRSLKHQWLYLNQLDTKAAVEKLVRFYVEQHNSVMPHSALGGLTPDEVYFEKGAGVREQLEAAWRKARAERLATNRGANCGTCKPAEPAGESSVISDVSQLRTEGSRMFT
jgi:putative transposase